MKIVVAWLVCLIAAIAQALDNGLGLTPQMGWNSWNHFHCNVNDTIVRDTADAIVAKGLDKHGYKYVNIDDCWAGSRDSNGSVVPDPKTFPNMTALANYVHSKGLMFGVYSDAGNMTCAKRPGSLGHETSDANSYAKWGVDYLKYDDCNNEGIDPKKRYPPMRDALNKTGRPIFFSMCDAGDHPEKWAAEVGNSWRTTGDISENWNSIIQRADSNNNLWQYAGRGGWNDPDMLEIGNGGMSTTEYQTHFSLWCLMKAPLLIGCDLTKISDDDLKILSNDEVMQSIRINLEYRVTRRRLWVPMKYGLGHCWMAQRPLYCLTEEIAQLALLQNGLIYRMG